jgi:hypothetical protein
LISGAEVEKKIERTPAGQPGQQRDEADDAALFVVQANFIALHLAVKLKGKP